MLKVYFLLGIVAAEVSHGNNERDGAKNSQTLKANLCQVYYFPTVYQDTSKAVSLLITRLPHFFLQQVYLVMFLHQ